MTKDAEKEENEREKETVFRAKHTDIPERRETMAQRRQLGETSTII